MEQNISGSSGPTKISTLAALLIILTASAAFSFYLWGMQALEPDSSSVSMGQAQKAEAIDGWQTYQNNDFGFEFKYPPGWQIKTKQDSGKTVIEIVDPQKANIVGYAAASVTVIPNRPGLSLDDWWSAATQNTNYQKIGEATIAGQKALKLRVKDTDAQPRYVFIGQEKGGFIFGIYADDSEAGIVENILGSFKIN